ncbi:MAG: SPASM domain-containing protein [Clostridiales bacterium]|nr:SPASM domain-containing protein [Clostridiales bacterium]
MNFTLHVTADCNLACRYCYEKHTPERMDERTALAACDLMFSYGHKQNGFSFFGGEPLLCRELIEKVLAYCSELNESRGGRLAYRMTTNGILLDEAFAALANRCDLEIALSHDGLLQDDQRVRKDGSGTMAALEPKIDLLLRYQPGAIAMLTVLPENVGRLADSVKWLYDRGFSKINAVIDLRPDAAWDDDSMALLDAEYLKIVDLSAVCYDLPRPLKFLNFESKIAAHIENRGCIECRLGYKQPSIAPDGNIYPCNQFLNLAEYRIGDVFSGIDKAAQKRVYDMSTPTEASCTGCAIEKRCRHHCACLNFSMTGDMHTVPPVQCLHEQSVIKNADLLAKRLYEEKSPRFMRAYSAKSN